ncbi:MAG: hypothetical protein ACI832_003008 [Rheinheimera aquimaris]|jgi:hypothetical protein
MLNNKMLCLYGTQRDVIGKGKGIYLYFVGCYLYRECCDMLGDANK